MAMSELPEPLKPMLQENLPQAWLGKQSPTGLAAIDLFAYPNLRAPSSHHGQYGIVWLSEFDLGKVDERQVDLILDEALRLLGPGGRIVFQFRESKHFSIFQLKHFIGRRYGIKARVQNEFRHGKKWCVVCEVVRDDWQRYQAKGWTFGILTQGVRVDNLRAFFESIRAQSGGEDAEILVCGPKLPQFEQYRLNYLHVEVREDLAEICKKKNEIAQAAAHPNLCLVHDRYRLESNFFTGFEAFGYDFDYLTVKQNYESGEHFPDYCALSQHELTWNTSLDCRDINYVLPRQYINGGVIIAKTQTLREIPFNELVFWNQAEDVELAKAYRDRSIPPRCNAHSSMVTLGIDASYTKKILPYHANPGWGELGKWNTAWNHFFVRCQRRWKYPKK
jgi:hypothetical protein